MYNKPDAHNLVKEFKTVAHHTHVTHILPHYKCPDLSTRQETIVFKGYLLFIQLNN